MTDSEIRITCHTDRELASVVSGREVLVLTDEHVAAKCLPLLPSVASLPICVIPAGDEHKTLQTVERVWRFMAHHRATRHTLLLCVGGGMVSDLGGFAASTFMRGVAHAHVATSLLSAVDASVGGKTGFNYLGVKNLIGSYSMPERVLIALDLMDTLPAAEWLSGYGELLKHALIDGPELLGRTLALDVDRMRGSELAGLVERNLRVKRRYVRLDPQEQGQRKVLNLGHTVGHAIEARAQALGVAMPHGHAVARGLVAELYLSHALLGLPADVVSRVRHQVVELYGAFDCPCREVGSLISLMLLDKKRTPDTSVNFTLLADVGRPVIDCTAPAPLIEEAVLYV